MAIRDDDLSGFGPGSLDPWAGEARNVGVADLPVTVGRSGARRRPRAFFGQPSRSGVSLEFSRRDVAVFASDQPDAALLVTPYADFDEIWIRPLALADEDGFILSVELVHTDPARTVLLHASADPSAAGSCWLEWVRYTGLPARVFGEDGEVLLEPDACCSLQASAPWWHRPLRRPNPLWERRSFFSGGPPRGLTADGEWLYEAVVQRRAGARPLGY